MSKAMQMYLPNPAADALAARLIRFLLCACLLAPLLSACATTAQRAVRHEHAHPACLNTARK